MIMNVDLTKKQQCFLDAYRETANVSRAAKLSGVHRSSVYRWKCDAAFVGEMTEAFEAFLKAHRAKIAIEQQERQRWREERERARHSMRCHFLALARAAKRIYLVKLTR